VRVEIGTTSLVSKLLPHWVFYCTALLLLTLLIMIENPDAVTDVIAVSGNDDADCTIFFIRGVGSGDVEYNGYSSAGRLFD